MTEAELKDEVMARIGAEKQLQAAEKALEHLEAALTSLDANKPLIMRNALPPRRSIRRSKTRLRSSIRCKVVIPPQTEDRKQEPQTLMHL